MKVIRLPGRRQHLPDDFHYFLIRKTIPPTHPLMKMFRFEKDIVKIGRPLKLLLLCADEDVVDITLDALNAFQDITHQSDKNFWASI